MEILRLSLRANAVPSHHHNTYININTMIETFKYILINKLFELNSTIGVIHLTPFRVAIMLILSWLEFLKHEPLFRAFEPKSL